jgi:hypothetical protein
LSWERELGKELMPAKAAMLDTSSDSALWPTCVAALAIIILTAYGSARSVKEGEVRTSDEIVTMRAEIAQTTAQRVLKERANETNLEK